MKDILYTLNPWWRQQEFFTGTKRGKYLNTITDHIPGQSAILLIGSRRVGKTTLLHQVINDLLQKQISAHTILYVLADHPKLSSASFLDIVEEARKIHNLPRREKLYIFFDEAQYHPRWEQEAKTLIDTEAVKVFLSGSSSTVMLQKTTFLTGRFTKITVDPLDFLEFLDFRTVSPAENESYLYDQHLQEYLAVGGYPEYVLSLNPRYFADLVESVVFKDIAALWGVKNPSSAQETLLLLADRSGHQTSFTKLSHIVGRSVATTKDYVSYLCYSFLVEEIARFSESRNKRIYAAKKFYIHDNGLLFHLTGRLNQGASAERTLFAFLKKRFPKVYFYYENGKEIDFVAEEADGERVLIESKYGEESTLPVMRKTMAAAARKLDVRRAYCITKNNESADNADGIVFKHIPLWRVLLGDQNRDDVFER